MKANIFWARLKRGFFRQNGSEEESSNRYVVLRNRIVFLMLLVTLLPLSIMAIINHHEYKKNLKEEIVNPMQIIVNKTTHSFELYLEERLSIVRFIASSYSFEELSDGKTLNRIFRILINEYLGFIDLGLIDDKGNQLSYVGPYSLAKKNYSQQPWFQEVMVRGVYISDVFMGFRELPHIALAVQRRSEEGYTYIIRATLDTKNFDNLIAAMGFGPECDAFLVNRECILQTASRFYGKILDKCPISLPRGTFSTQIIETVDFRGREILVAYGPFVKSDYALLLVRPRSVVLKSWYTLKREMFFVFTISVVIIILVVFKLTDILFRQIKQADERRESAFRELEHSHKLSSIGRLAAGVAHEINNPLAIINEKAGLMNDLIKLDDSMKHKTKFLGLINSIIKSVDRCKSITHRLLGFARRIEVQFEFLDLNEVLHEVIGFLEREALYRNIVIHMNLATDLPKISSDRGQLHQVFLNILVNALAAVDDGGEISITSWDVNPERVAVSIQDNGHGMSEETQKQIFEPFFTTKKGYGTGLGLPITYGIIKKLGGDIKVCSQEEKGTTFTVYLNKNPKVVSGGYDG